MDQFEADINSRVSQAEEALREQFQAYERMARINQKKILKAMQHAKLSQGDFHWSTGYGYGDMGREKTEEIYREVFRGEDALVRPNIVSGTHALTIVLKALTNAGDTMVSVTGDPYDTLQRVIGIQGHEKGNLKSRGIHYRSLPLKEDGSMDLEGIPKAIEGADLILLQRSSGYTSRRAFTISELEEAIKIIKEHSQAPVFIDNCYGEFTEEREPLEVGADIIAGSLIKNPGGGLALSGGYICGKRELVEACSNELTAPGVGKECGLTFGQTRNVLMGLFLAPRTVEECLKGATLYAQVFDQLGYQVVPSPTDPRSDIVQVIALEDPKRLEAFCRSIQGASPIDSYVTPMAWDMPGYSEPVIMAAGGFIDGSSIELSADGPMREPYNVYVQGGLTYAHCVLALESVLEDLEEQGLLQK
ncbi:MAG: methionine gamma-lyase family protein [Tissierellia bacterium]|nr:methionine gamma-lyase family protein [Tissierellia bacterium]